MRIQGFVPDGLTAETQRLRGKKKQKKHQMGITWMRGLHGLENHVSLHPCNPYPVLVSSFAL
jgi:hypothetical protein